MKKKSSGRLRVACLQMSAGPSWQDNLMKAYRMTEQALSHGFEIAALPEMFILRGSLPKLRALARDTGPEIIRRFQRLAAKKRAAVLLGSLPENSRGGGKLYNTAYLIDENGRLACRYRKIHLFDVTTRQGVRFRESAHFSGGQQIVCGKVFGVKTGLTICYDLRFPELYRHLTKAGCRMIFVPANFTRETGHAHWETLIKARAIENQIFIIAPGQVGIHPVTGVRSHGNSLIVDPWGKVLGKGGMVREEIIRATIDFSVQKTIRRDFPSLRHMKIRF